MDWNPHITVATVIEKDQQFLMVEEWVNGQLVLNQPAGHLEPDETLLEAAYRETLEETAWQVDISAVLGLALYKAPGNGVTYYRTTFIGAALRHFPERELDKDIENVLWMSIEQLQQNRHRLRSPLVLKTLEKYLNGERYPLELFYNEG